VSRAEPRSIEDQRRFRTCVGAFSGARCPAIYRTWLQDGETPLKAVSSHQIADALKSGAGKIEPQVLPHAYSHLSPLVGVA
jgi:hypothetical protein